MIYLAIIALVVMVILTLVMGCALALVLLTALINEEDNYYDF